MSKEIKPNLLVHKGLAVKALGEFIQVLLSEALRDMAKNVDKIIISHVDKLAIEKEKSIKVDLSKIDFNSLAIEVKKEIVRTFENMKTEFEEPKTDENQR